jgi:hypothetical protein
MSLAKQQGLHIGIEGVGRGEVWRDLERPASCRALSREAIEVRDVRIFSVSCLSIVCTDAGI